MRKVFFLLITLAIATNSLAQEQFSDKEAALTRFYMMNCNEVKQNKILLLPKFLELNPTHDEVNEFIVNSYLGTEDYFLQSGYTWQNWENSAWENYQRQSSTLNESGLILTTIYENWNGTLWQNHYKYENVYNSNNKIETAYSYNYYSGNWVYEAKYEYSYDQNNQLDTVIVYSWNGFIWEYNFRQLYNCASNGNIVELINQNCD